MSDEQDPARGSGVRVPQARGLGPPETRGASPLGSNLDRLRTHNLSVVLQQLHYGGPASRSNLATLTGLNRSTVTILINELIDMGLVVEPERVVDAGAKKSVGRPSVDVAVNDRVFAIAVVPEVDAISVAVVSLGGAVRRVIHYDTISSHTLRDMVSVVSVIVQGILAIVPADAQIIGIGVAVPGLTNDKDGSVTLAPQLNWRAEPLAAELEATTGLPVRVSNDAQACLLAETSFGGAHGGNVIFLNGGANRIGGGIIVGGQVLRGSHGYAGELGHFRIRSGGTHDSAGLQGTLESEVNRDVLVEKLGLDRRDFHRLDEVLAEQRAPGAQAEIDKQVAALGTALGAMVSIFNPDQIVLGGFLGALLDAEPTKLRNAVARETLAPLLDAVDICRPTLGPELQLIGAAELAFEPLLTDPARIDSTGEGAARTA